MEFQVGRRFEDSRDVAGTGGVLKEHQRARPELSAIARRHLNLELPVEDHTYLATRGGMHRLFQSRCHTTNSEAAERNGVAQPPRARPVACEHEVLDESVLTHGAKANCVDGLRERGFHTGNTITVVETMGLEPTTPCLQSRCSSS